MDIAQVPCKMHWLFFIIPSCLPASFKPAVFAILAEKPKIELKGGAMFPVSEYRGFDFTGIFGVNLLQKPMMRIILIVNAVRRVPQQGTSVTGDSGFPRGQVSLPNGIQSYLIC